MGKVFGSVFGIFLLFLALNLVLGGLATEYVVEFWVGYNKGHVVDVPFLPCAIAGLFLGELMIPAAVITWLCSLVM